METKNEQTPRKKTLVGIVVSDKMDKTVVVRVDRYVKHKKYGKYMRVRKNYKVDDPGNTCAVGERVRIEEIPRVSKHKAFRILKSEERP